LKLRASLSAILIQPFTGWIFYAEVSQGDEMVEPGSGFDENPLP